MQLNVPIIVPGITSAYTLYINYEYREPQRTICAVRPYFWNTLEASSDREVI